MLNKNSSIKVLHVLDHSLPLHDGYSFRSQSIIHAQKSRGWEQVVLTSSKHEQSWKGAWKKEEEIGGVRYYRTGALSSSAFPLHGEIQLLARLGRRLREVIELEKPDLIHVHSPVLNLLPSLRIGRKLGIPVVYEIRAFWEDAAVARGSYRENSWRYRLVKALETWACHQADHVAVLCQGIKNDLVQRGLPPEKLSIVHNGVNVEDFKPCEPDEEYMNAWKLQGRKVIGFMGSFFRYEGLDLLIHAVARLATTRPDAVLLLAGGGEMENELKAQIERLKLGSRVILAGRISHGRIPAIYSLVNVLVYPRYSSRLTELVTPLKPLEAMAMGKALVASDIGGHRELIEHGRTGLLFPSGEPLILAGLLEQLLEKEEVCRTLGMQGNSWVRQERSWDRTTAVYRDIYSKVLDASIL